jgi:hypothetical protein
MNFRIVFSSSMNVIGILMVFALILQIDFGNMATSIILICLIHEHGKVLPSPSVFCLLQFLSSVFYNFHHTSLVSPWLGVFLGFFFFS